MMMETISPLMTSQKPPVENDFPLMVVCDVADHHALAAVSEYLQTAGLLSPDVNVPVVAPTAFANPKVQELLLEDRAMGRIGFVLIKDNSCRHYFKTAEQVGFSIRITPLQ